VFGPGDVSREIVENAVGAASALLPDALLPEEHRPAGNGPAGDWAMVAVDSPAARRRLVVVAGADDPLRAAPTLVVVCVRTPSESAEEAILLSAGAAIRGLAVALHAQGVAWSWAPARPFDADGVGAALSLGDDWQPLGIVAVGRMPEGGASRPRPPDPTDALEWRG
jgi:coenzyme F420-0:L-glutamate ligase/coenzyme F420-1:gamma-L-glutamate ligase